MDFGRELFSTPYKERIIRVLPTLFNIVELENRRGDRLGMEVGTARERVLVALFMYVYGPDEVTFPPTTSPKMDIIVKGFPVSIKTKTGQGLTGVKLVWTVDWSKINEFRSSYSPSSELLFININWGSIGRLYLIPLHVQKEVFESLSSDNYMKFPKRGTNPRGVELSKDAMEMLLEHACTRHLAIQWDRDPIPAWTKLDTYRRWIELWNTH